MSARINDRFFDFGDRNREMYVRIDGPQLNSLITAADGTRHRLEVAGILQVNEWCHVASVSGPGGVKFRFSAPLPGQYVLRAMTDEGPLLFASGQPVEMKWGTVLTNLEFNPNSEAGHKAHQERKERRADRKDGMGRRFQNPCGTS